MSSPRPTGSPALRYCSLWLPVILWCGLIFFLSHIPHLRITPSDWDMLLRKMAHMVEYGILTLLFWRALHGTMEHSATAEEGRPFWRGVTFITIVFAIAYASTDEFHQTFIAGRHGSPVDVMIDSAGIFAAAIFRPRIARLFQWIGSFSSSSAIVPRR